MGSSPAGTDRPLGGLLAVRARPRTGSGLFAHCGRSARRGSSANRDDCLTRELPPEKREEAIFEIVNQFNRGAGLITSEDERFQVAELNLSPASEPRLPRPTPQLFSIPSPAQHF